MSDKPKSHAEIIAEMYSGIVPKHRHDREILLHYARLLDMAHQRELATENTAKLREVVEDLLYMAKRYAAKTPATETVIFDGKTHKALKTINYHKTIEKAEAALAAPARNCDVGTAKEQVLEFKHQCFNHHTGRCSPHCKFAGCKSKVECALTWAQMTHGESEVAQ